jgi:tRNA U38,U39,U40 pseudouridine synthase TruA
MPTTIRDVRVYTSFVSRNNNSIRTLFVCLFVCEKRQLSISSRLVDGATFVSRARRASHDNAVQFIEFSLSQHTFLYKQVRNIVGALVAVGREQVTPAQLMARVAGGDRAAMPPTAPPHGLYFHRADYDADYDADDAFARHDSDLDA